MQAGERFGQPGGAKGARGATRRPRRRPTRGVRLAGPRPARRQPDRTVRQRHRPGRLLLLAPLALAGWLPSSAGASPANVRAVFEPHGISALEPARPATDFRLPPIQGDLTSVSEARGRWVVLTFFATWCGPCRAELPTLERLAGDLGESVTVLGVAIDDRREPVEPFLRKLGIRFPVVWDGRGEAARAYQAWSIPVTYLIDPAGQVQGVSRGARDWSDLAGMMGQLAALAPAAPGAQLASSAPSPASAGPASQAAFSSPSLDLPGDLAPPSATVVLSPSEPRAGQPFHLDVRVRWAGSLAQYVLLPPSVSMPEGVEQRGLSAETTSEAGSDVLTYRVALAVQRPGEYVLGPVELRYAPQGSAEPLSSRVPGPTVRIRPWTVAGLSPIALAATGTGAAAAAVAAFTLVRRRRKRTEPTADPLLPALEAALLEARRLRLSGDAVGSFLTLARLERELGVAENDEPKLQAAEERARYGNQPPPPDEMDYWTRHVERSLAERSPGMPKERR